MKKVSGVSRSFIVTLLLCCQTLIGFSQSADSLPKPYTLRRSLEIKLTGIALATDFTSFLLGQNLKSLTLEQINALNRQDVPSFNRSATYKWSPQAATLSDFTLIGNIGIVGLITLPTIWNDGSFVRFSHIPSHLRKDWLTVPVMYLEATLLANGIQRSIKNAVGETRPFVYSAEAPLDKKLERDARRAFFSGHATNAFMSAVFASEVFRHYYPTSRLKPLVWGSSLLLATGTSFLRYEAGKHYPTDLLVGAAFGSLVGWGIPKLHELNRNPKVAGRLTVSPWSNGLASGFYVRWKLNSTNFAEPLHVP